MSLSDVTIDALQHIKCRLETEEDRLSDVLHVMPVGKDRDTAERALFNLREAIRELVEFT